MILRASTRKAPAPIGRLCVVELPNVVGRNRRDGRRYKPGRADRLKTDDGFAFIDREKFKAGFAQDVSDADVGFMRDAQVPINLLAFETMLMNAAWRFKPSWAVIANEEKAFDQAMLIHMAERLAGAKGEVRPENRGGSRAPPSRTDHWLWLKRGVGCDRGMFAADANKGRPA